MRSKVAYPDLTVDLRTRDHVVIGLENGGGKSTLLGFLIHVFLPGATQFLPRLAQRRQKKEGEEKRIEHYVPGGPPTHVVIELELPDSAGSARDLSGRVLVGACLYKDAGADASVRAEEFLWSARCVTEGLTLTGLGLRGDGGRMLDHREWRAWLERMKDAHPGEVQVYDTQKGWDSHLRYELRVDVEFVRSWLLQMNEDEGAADHVFTYASSRAFLNSLVGAVADPDLMADLKKGTIQVQNG